MASKPGSAFLVLAWQELTDTGTPPIFKPRVHHAVSILREVSAVAQQATEDERWKRHLPHVVAEAKWLCEHDPVVNTQPRFAHDVKLVWREQDPSSMARIARVAADSFNYAATVRSLLAREITSAQTLNVQRKAAVQTLLALLATELNLSGVLSRSFGHLDASWMERDAPDISIELSGLLERPVGSWRVFMNFGAAQGAGELRVVCDEVGLRRARKAELPAGQTTVTGDAFIIQRDVEAISASGAAALVAAEVRRALDLASFYHRKVVASLPSTVIVVRGAQVQNVDLHAYSTISLREPADARDKFRSTIKRFGDDAYTRVAIAIEQYALSVASADPRIKLLNLWSGLESFVGGGSGSSIIQRVVDTVVPVLASRTVDQLVRYVSISVHRDRQLSMARGNPSAFSTTGSFPKTAQSERVWPEEITLALCSKDSAPPILELFSAIGHHPLLRNRVRTLWETFSDPKKLAGKIERSRNTLDWQLRRIYRARNMMVHRGESAVALGTLVEHLELYFDLTISRVIHDLNRNVTWTVDDCFTHRRMSYDWLVTALKSGRSGDLRMDDLISDAKILSDRPLWL